jgi:hypothetical protein
MPKATDCVISVETALRFRDILRKARESDRVFHCKECNWAVRPEIKSDTGAAHFEHSRRNLDCRLSDKRTARRAYSAYKSAR